MSSTLYTDTLANDTKELKSGEKLPLPTFDFKDVEECSLSHTMKVEQIPAANRYLNNFQPPDPENSLFVSTALISIMKPSSVLRRIRQPFQAVSPDQTLLDYNIDANEPQKQESKGIEDVFAKPTEQKSETPDEEQEQAHEVQKLISTTLLETKSFEASKTAFEQQDDKKLDCVMWRFQPNWAQNFTEDSPAEFSICKRIPRPLWTRDMGLQFLVTAKNLTFSSLNNEPYFCTLSLYDIRRHKRISENFHFDLNHISVLQGTCTD